MIRITLLAIAFVAVTFGLLVFQPGATQIRDRLAWTDATPVTRAAATPDTLAVAPVSRTAPAASDDVSAVLAALVREAGQPTAPAPSAGGGIPAASPNPAAAITAAVQAAQGTKGDELAQMTNALLAELGGPVGASTADGDALMAMTNGVLAGLRGVSAPADPARPVSLQTLVVQALREGQSDAYLDALLNEARDTGRVVVPEALVTSDNKVDTATLLASLVQRSVGGVAAGADGGPDVTRPQARPLANAQVYTVQPGDSLAAIAFRFYGETLQYTAIYDANRDTISTPDKIRVGQELTIPVL